MSRIQDASDTKVSLKASLKTAGKRKGPAQKAVAGSNTSGQERYVNSDSFAKNAGVEVSGRLEKAGEPERMNKPEKNMPGKNGAEKTVPVKQASGKQASGKKMAEKKLSGKKEGVEKTPDGTTKPGEQQNFQEGPGLPMTTSTGSVVVPLRPVEHLFRCRVVCFSGGKLWKPGEVRHARHELDPAHWEPVEGGLGQVGLETAPRV